MVALSLRLKLEDEVASFGGSRRSWMAGHVGPSLLLVGISSGAVACSEGSTSPLPAAVAGGTGDGGAAAGVAAGGSSGGLSGTTAAGGGNAAATRAFDFTEGLDGFRISYYCLGPGVSEACSPVDAAAPVGDA